jgi:polysaccharide biosynthesis/export protein
MIVFVRFVACVVIFVFAVNQGSRSAAAPTAPPVQPAALPTPSQESSAGQTDAGYVLGISDVVEVSVLNQPEFKTRARVRADGAVALPFIGSTPVTGETSLSLTKKITDALVAGGFYSKPIVTVDIASYASRYVIVLGAVGQPGLQPVDRSYRLSEIIARSGGIRENGADYVVLRHAGGAEMKLPYEKLATGSEADDPLVGPGDKIFVPAAEAFFIYGQVNAPGTYVLKGSMTLRKALARGGGLTPSGSDKRVTVFRDGKKIIAVLEAPVLAGDVVVVGERLF